MSKSIIGLYTGELRSLLQKEKLPAYRGNQIAEWIYGKGIINFNKMTNLPVEVIDILRSKYDIGSSQIIKIQKSSDGTLKLLLELSDGEKIETVGLPYAERFACCVSTQVGCTVGCVFCATGKCGFKRNLTAGEIVDQILEIHNFNMNDSKKMKALNESIHNVVFMGMGEPLLNYDESLKALKLINQEIKIGARQLTLSTIGYVPGIKRLMKEKLQITLAVSLHAATDKVRRLLVPGMAKWSLQEIVDVCKEYFEQTNRRITFEYCLIHNINDSDDAAKKLAGLIYDMNSHVNLIPYNRVSGIPFYPPTPERILEFTRILKNEGINVTRRVPRGIDIDAACGQLRYKELVKG
jgi:23S rRNA (adenine2503-C2)-methyltransferase